MERHIPFNFGRFGMADPQAPDWLDVPLQKELTGGDVILSCRYQYQKGHDYDNHVVPAKRTPYLTISCSRGTSWNSPKWEELQELYEASGYRTNLRKSSGVTRTRSGTCHHAPTSMYVWNPAQIGDSPRDFDEDE